MSSNNSFNNIFLIWQSASIYNTSIAMLETVPQVKDIGEIKLDYEIYKDNNYIITEKYDWVLNATKQK